MIWAIKKAGSFEAHLIISMTGIYMLKAHYQALPSFASAEMGGKPFI